MTVPELFLPLDGIWFMESKSIWTPPASTVPQAIFLRSKISWGSVQVRQNRGDGHSRRHLFSSLMQIAKEIQRVHGSEYRFCPHVMCWVGKRVNRPTQSKPPHIASADSPATRKVYHGLVLRNLLEFYSVWTLGNDRSNMLCSKAFHTRSRLSTSQHGCLFVDQVGLNPKCPSRNWSFVTVCANMDTFKYHDQQWWATAHGQSGTGVTMRMFLETS